MGEKQIKKEIAITPKYQKQNVVRTMCSKHVEGGVDVHLRVRAQAWRDATHRGNKTNETQNARTGYG